MIKKSTFYEIRFVRYCIVGIITLVLYVCIFVLLRDFFSTPLVVTIFFAYGVAAVVRFILHRSWVFDRKNVIVHMQTVRYIVMLLASYALSSVSAIILTEVYSPPSIVVGFFSAVLSSIFAYLVSLLWVFR